MDEIRNNIKKNGNSLTDFIEDSREFSGIIIAAFTDVYKVREWKNFLKEWDNSSDEQKKKDEDKLMELRLFNKNSEKKLIRSKKGLILRVIEDEPDKMKSDHIFDEIQYLDIDTEKSGKNGKIITTGGGDGGSDGRGEIELPIGRIDGARVRIRYYLDEYAETGQVRVRDWRVVEIMEGK